MEKTITIGKQVWMLNNLNVDKFRNGDPIPEVTTNEEWQDAEDNEQPAWCYYGNDPINGNEYGKLYNRHALNDPRGLAPLGYHIPSEKEWDALKSYLADPENVLDGLDKEWAEEESGAKMKSTKDWENWTSGGKIKCPDCASWNAEYRRKVPCHSCKDTRYVSAPKVINTGNGNNTSGFSGLPGGFRDYSGSFGGFGCQGLWWSSSDLYLILENDNSEVHWSDDPLLCGLSVRCLKN